MKTLELIVPCYNEGAVLELFYRETSRVLDGLDGYQSRLIFVDDGSTDNTLEIVAGLSEADDRVKYISFSRNFGKEAAMLAGLSYSRAELVGILDADLQHSPQLICDMLEAIEQGYDVAAARRSDRKGEQGLKSTLSSLFYKIASRLTELELDDGAQDYRIMTRSVADAILSMTERHRFTKGIFSWVGFKTKWFVHENRRRAAGETKWSLIKLLKYALDGILGYCSLPLKLPLYLGALTSAAGVLYFICFLILHYGVGMALSGLHVVLAAVLFTGGLIMLCLGIIGAYLARIYDEAKNRPQFIVRESNIER